MTDVRLGNNGKLIIEEAIEEGGGGGPIPDPLNLGAAIFANYVSIGASPAQSGVLRVPFNEGLVSRRSNGADDMGLIRAWTDDVGFVDGVLIDESGFGVDLGGGIRLKHSAPLSIVNSAGDDEYDAVRGVDFSELIDFGSGTLRLGAVNNEIILCPSFPGLPTTDPGLDKQMWAFVGDISALTTYLGGGGKILAVSSG